MGTKFPHVARKMQIVLVFCAGYSRITRPKKGFNCGFCQSYTSGGIYYF